MNLPMRRRARSPLALLAAGLLVASAGLAGCGSDDTQDETFTVLAAASLTDVFEDLATDFESEHDGVKVEFNFASSTDLAEQAADGAPGDVLATADAKAMTIAEDANVLIGSPETFAANELVIVTPPDNPANISSIDDLADARWVRCADDAPCGRVALAVLKDNKITAQPGSLEEDVRATLDKVTSGEFDAGLVYASDAVAAGDDVETVPIDGAEAQETTYLMAALDQTNDEDLAAEWLDLVNSDRGQQALEDAGFTLP